MKRLSLVLFTLGFSVLGCTADDEPVPDGGTADNDSGESNEGNASKAEPDDASKETGAKREDSPKDDAAPSKPQPTPAKSKDPTPPPADDDAGAAAPAADGGTPNAASNSAPNANANQAATGDEIEIVMMDVAYVLNVSGQLTPEPRPMILFKDGWACRDINFVVRGLDRVAHKAKYPKDWVQWKTVDGKVALQNANNGWTTLYFQQKYPPSDRSRAFEDTFTRFSGGTLVDTTAFSQTSLHLSHDHRVLRGSFAAVTSPNSVTQATPPDQRGTYQIDGYTIEFKWDDGSTGKTSFVYSEQDPDAIYVGGAGFLLED